MWIDAVFLRSKEIGVLIPSLSCSCFNTSRTMSSGSTVRRALTRNWETPWLPAGSYGDWDQRSSFMSRPLLLCPRAILLFNILLNCQIYHALVLCTSELDTSTSMTSLPSFTANAARLSVKLLRSWVAKFFQEQKCRLERSCPLEGHQRADHKTSYLKIFPFRSVAGWLE